MINLACMLCHQFSRTPVCEYCEGDIPFFAEMNFPVNLLQHPRIANMVRHANYSQINACGYFTWPLKPLLVHLKYRRRMVAGKVLADWFVEHALDHTVSLPQVLLPVPINYRRYFTRRFNQTVELATHLGKHLNIPVNTDWAQRFDGKRGGVKQQSLNRQQRLLNLQHAFSVAIDKPYKHIAIVDDVLTTGTTVDLLARHIKRQSPTTEISVWAMAITNARE